jgi:hypothetical protein
MTEAPMFAVGEKRQERAVWPFSLAFALVGLAWGLSSAFPLTIEPRITSAGGVFADGLLPALLHGAVILPAFVVACMIFKRGLFAAHLALVAAVAVLTPIAAPFAGEAAAGVHYSKERAVLGALDSETLRQVSELEAKLAAADLGELLTPGAFADRDFPAYRARVKSYRDASDSLRQILEGREKALEMRLADSPVPAERRTIMLANARAATAEGSARVEALHTLRIKVADSADAGLALLARPNSWRLWHGQLGFNDPQVGADFGQHVGAVRESLAALRRLEGRREVIGATAQKRATP